MRPSWDPRTLFGVLKVRGMLRCENRPRIVTVEHSGGYCDREWAQPELRHFPGLALIDVYRRKDNVPVTNNILYLPTAPLDDTTLSNASLPARRSTDALAVIAEQIEFSFATDAMVGHSFLQSRAQSTDYCQQPPPLCSSLLMARVAIPLSPPPGGSRSVAGHVASFMRYIPTPGGQMVWRG